MKSKSRSYFSVLLIIIVNVVLPTFSSAQSISAGWYHSLAVCTDSAVWGWGSNPGGELGNGTTTNAFLPLPTSSLESVVAIDAGAGYSLALKNNGTVWSCGWNQYGQLGNGIPADTNFTPMQVNALTDITAISAGGFHALALKNDGTVWGWGYNNYGQLGSAFAPDTNNLAMPISSLSNITAIAAGGHHSLVIKSDSTVWAWGWNNHGQLGDGSGLDSYVPVQVSGLTGIIAIAGNGETNSMALKSDGTVWAWGWNNYGQLGNGTHTDSNVPVQVNTLTGIIAIGGGIYHSLALKNDSTVWAWGWNTYGQLGNGTNIDTSLAVQVNSVSGITEIAGGSGHSVARKSDGTIWCWGLNGYGALGNGVSSDSNIPLQAIGFCSPPCAINDSVYADYPTCACPGQLIAFDTATSYQWFDCNNGNAFIAGATGQTFTILQTGDYGVIITDGACADTSVCIYGIATGIEEMPQSSFLLYPNPFSLFSTIQFEDPLEGAELNVFNSYGQNCLTRKNISGNSIKIDRDNLQAGIYFIRITQNNRAVLTEKLVVEN